VGDQGLAFGIAVWVFVLALGIAVSRGLLLPGPVGVMLSGAGALAGAIIAMDQAAGVLLAVATVAGLFAYVVLMHQVPLIGIGTVGTLYVVPEPATRYLPGSVAAPLAVAVVGLVLLGIALWLARQRRKEPAGCEGIERILVPAAGEGGGQSLALAVAPN
jgi:LPXTG-motif cell wall-anchored protein